MELIKMQYKGFVFPVNPASLTIESTKSIKINSLTDSTAEVSAVVQKPAAVSGTGVFYGDGGLADCMRLYALHRDNTDGWLFLPTGDAVRAYFKEFEYSCDTKSGGVTYRFGFVESACAKKPLFDPGYTYAQAGENLFDIAARTENSVSRLAALNDFCTPFSVTEGDRVVLR